MSTQAPTAQYLAADKGPRTLVFIILFPALALFVIGLRLYTRFSIVRSPSHEDFSIVLAMVFSIACCVCQAVEVSNGMGRHIEAVTYDQTVASFKALFASIILYNFGLTLTKMSILFQYLRIATGRPMRLLCWAIFWFTAAVCIETLFAGIFQCLPVQKFWDPLVPGKCVNTAALYYANAALNIAQDIVLVILPFFILRGLIMPRKEKLTLMLILGLGGIAAIASICRLHALYIVDITTDPTWDSPATAIWSAVELNMGIFCASLPTLRALFIRIWPRVFMSTHSSRRIATDPPLVARGQYYHMEGFIQVQKSVSVHSIRHAEGEEDVLPLSSK